MRAFGAYAVAIAIVLSVLSCANLALASQTIPPVSNNIAIIGIAPVGNDLSLIDIGGFLRTPRRVLEDRRRCVGYGE